MQLDAIEIPLDSNSVGFEFYWIQIPFDSNSIGFKFHWIQILLDLYSFDSKSIGFIQNPLDSNSIGFKIHWIQIPLNPMNFEWNLSLMAEILLGISDQYAYNVCSLHQCG
jgi:hypothetical protein